MLRSIQGADWEKAFDTRPSKSSLQSHIFSASKSSFFSESGILAAYSRTSQADMQRGSIETKNTKLLKYLFIQPVGEIQATNIEISSFIYLWGYDVFSSVLMKYRQELRVSNRHRQTHSPLSEDSLTALAKWAQNSIFSSSIPKLIASSDELGTATSEHSTDLPDTFACMPILIVQVLIHHYYLHCLLTIGPHQRLHTGLLYLSTILPSKTLSLLAALVPRHDWLWPHLQVKG